MNQQATAYRPDVATEGAELRGVGLTHRFGDRGRAHTVFSGLDIHIAAGELVGLVGPSGVGKSTLARLLCGHLAPTGGTVLIDGVAVSTRRGRMRRDIALIGQNPREATDPRWTLRRIIAEPGAVAGRCDADGRHEEVDRAADRCFVEPALLDRHPHEVSAGQLQRACVARALVQRPRFLVCDEPTSMLDPITTAGIMNVVRDHVRRGAGALLISHDHRLVGACAHRVLALQAVDGVDGGPPPVRVGRCGTPCAGIASRRPGGGEESVRRSSSGATAAPAARE